MKRAEFCVLLLLAALACSFPCSAESAQSLKIFSLKNNLLGSEYFGLKDDSGKIFVPAVYWKIQPLKNGKFFAHEGGSNQTKTLFDAGGNIIELKTESSEIELVDEQRGLFIISDNENSAREGIMDSTGKLLLASDYQDITYMQGSGLFAIQKNRRWGLSDGSGKVIIEPSYDFANAVGQGVVMSDPDHSIWVNNKGQEITRVTGESRSIDALGNTGLLKVCGNISKKPQDDNIVCGVIDNLGKFVMPMRYPTLLFLEGAERIAVSEQSVILFGEPINSFELYNLKGKRIAKIAAGNIENFGNRLAVTVRNENSRTEGLMDNDGRWLIQPSNIDISMLYEGWGVLNVEDKTPPLALTVAVKSDSNTDARYGVIAMNGKEILPAIYENLLLSYRGKDRYMVKAAGKTGVVNSKGEWIIPAEYEGQSPNSNLPWPWLMLTKKNDSTSNSDSNYTLVRLDTGKVVIPAKHEYLAVEESYAINLKNNGFNFDDAAITYGTDDLKTTVYNLEGRIISEHNCKVNGSPDAFGRMPCYTSDKTYSLIDGLDQKRKQQLQQILSSAFKQEPVPYLEASNSGKFSAEINGTMQPLLMIDGDDAAIDVGVIANNKLSEFNDYKFSICPEGQNFSLVLELFDNAYEDDSCKNPKNHELKFIRQVGSQTWLCGNCKNYALPTKWVRIPE
jgi:WG containing repeat